MSTLRLAGICLALLVLLWAAGPGGAAGQVVIEKRVEVTRSDSARSPLPPPVRDSIFGGITGTILRPKAAPPNKQPHLESHNDGKFFVARGKAGRLYLSLLYYNFRTNQQPDNPRLKIRVQQTDTTRMETVHIKDDLFPEEETHFEYLSPYGCIEAADANYTTWNRSTWSTQACSFLPNSAAISLGKVEPGDTVRVGYHSMGQEIGPYPYSGRWCNARQRYKRHLLFDGDACMSDPFPGLVRARLVIERPPLKITIPGNNKAWPQIHARAADASYNREQVESTIEDIQVRLQDGGTPVAGQEVTIEEKWTDDTGGHVHNGDVCPGVSATEEIELGSAVRRKMKTEKGTEGKGKITAVTDENGEVVIPKYKTPTVSGKWVLEASTTLDGDEFTVRDTIEVRVPDLVRLPDPGGGDGYTKIGGTNSHSGENNHFGTQAVVDSLQSLASSWQALVTESDSLLNRQTPLRINDISSPKGGLFDVCGDWSTPHQFHRVGKDVDIRTAADSSQLEQRRGVLLQTARRITEEGETELYRENQRFEEVVEEIGGSPEPHSEFTYNEHYHIYFYP